MKDLKDTVNLMTSEAYKERFKGEYWQTKIRYEKLKHFCDRIEAAEMVDHLDGPQHDCPIYLLREQQKQMGQYLHILELRAIIEEVDLEV